MKYDKPKELTEKIAILPTTPGVYTYYDDRGNVIYVGKAKNLKRRVSSYFNRTHDVVRTNLLVRAIADMSYIVVPTEQDALNLENSMIKEYKPRYNVLLKDDKSYPWIVVTNEHFPRVFLTRQRLKDGSKYFGPYTDTASAKTVLELIRQLYPVRTCRHPITPDWIDRGKGRLCLEYHLKKCEGCCVGKITMQRYAGYIDRIRMILRGDTAELLTHLENDMSALAASLKFEEAHEVKKKYDLVNRYESKSVIVSQTLDQIDVFGISDEGDNDVYINHMHVRRGAVVRSLTLHYRRTLQEPASQLLSLAISEIAERFGPNFDEVIVEEMPDAEFHGVGFTVPQRGDKAKLLAVSKQNAAQSRTDAIKRAEKLDPEQRVMRVLKKIQSDFRLPELPRHIECFDNSNIQGTDPVASCVVFRNAKPAKKDYRIFNIQTVEGPDDFASMKEALTRRYTRMMQEAPDDLPQLIVVDGGKGQLSAAVEALESIGLRGTISVVGIAKRLEEIYFPGDSYPLYIDKNSETLRVVQHLRDEAHRFGITHHRQRRSRGQIRSELDSIAGIGPKTKELLLKKFRSVAAIRQASEAQLSELIGPAKTGLLLRHFSDKQQSE
ncbi:MAG: excinuclease ABC subunit UvrC [Muribaculaceae bacterium]|nr:excinuclease ABC subunit UvrC [Muribaculaceae bacterium]